MARTTAQAGLTTERLEADWLRAPGTRAVMAALGEDNLRFVGGAVRDSLLGLPVGDVDIATPLAPGEVMARLAAAGLGAKPTGLAHGTITAISDHRPFEVTTLRHDVETFGRHARVVFTDDWQADAARRDFTMNALYCDPQGRVFDYHGGLADARAGRVRFIGRPADRIAEDALRILRFFRFHARFGQGPPDAAGLAACAAGREQLDGLSVERVRDELLKLLVADDPCAVVAALGATHILRHILPEAVGTARLAPLVALERRLARPDALRRLAALLGVEEQRLADAGRRLKLSNRQRARLAAIAGPVPDIDGRALRAALYRDGAETVADRLFLAGSMDGLAMLDGLAGQARPVLPVSGRDLARAGLASGPAMGATLRRLEQAWIASDFSLDRASLLELARTTR